MEIKDVITHLLLHEPYYGYLAGKVRFIKNSEVSDIRLAHEKGIVIFYNPVWFSSLNRDYQIGAIIHELLHLALLHPFRREGRQETLWQMACDVAVTEFMPSEMISETLVTRTVILREMAINLEAEKSAEYYYVKIKDEEDRLDLTYDTGRTSVEFESGQQYHSSDFEDMVETDIETKGFIQSLAALQSVSRREGVIDLNLGSYTDQLYEPYQTNWRNILKRFLSGQGRTSKRASYKRLSRRFEDMPGTKRSNGIRALVAVDESSSISNEEVAAFHKELLRINQITGSDISAVRFDVTCSEPTNLNAFVMDHKRLKRGGTDFRPVFEVADNMHMPVVILFTDGDGIAPERVKQKVLWVLTGQNQPPVKYGTAVNFNAD